MSTPTPATTDTFWGRFSATLDRPHLRWLGRDPVTLPVPAGCTGIRIQARNPIAMPLHIAGVQFFSERGREHPSGLEASASSWWSGSAATPAEQVRALLDRPYGCGIHTEAEAFPWIALQMQPLPAALLMVVFNRCDLWAWRNEWVSIHATLADGSEHCLFDHRQATCDWLAGLRADALRSSPYETVRQLVALELLQALALGDPALCDNPAATNHLWNHTFAGMAAAFAQAHDHRLGAEFIQLSKVAALRHLEVGSHGVSRTFRFLDFQTKAGLLARTLKLSRTLDTLGYRSCLAYGTVLGLVRDDDLIPHDDDVDLHAILPTPPAGDDLKAALRTASESLCKELREHGWTVVDLQSHVQVRHEADFNTFAIDVFPSFEQPGELLTCVNHKGPVGSSARFQIGERRFGRLRLPMPAEAELYCQGVYGRSWRTPISHYNHSWL